MKNKKREKRKIKKWREREQLGFRENSCAFKGAENNSKYEISGKPTCVWLDFLITLIL